MDILFYEPCNPWCLRYSNLFALLWSPNLKYHISELSEASTQYTSTVFLHLLQLFYVYVPWGECWPEGQAPVAKSPYQYCQNLLSQPVDEDLSTDGAVQPFNNWGLFLGSMIGGSWINESEAMSFDSWFKGHQFLKRKKRDAPVKLPRFPNACCTSWYLGRVARLPSPATEGLDVSIRKLTRLTSSTVTFSARDDKAVLQIC